jgi:hypothetical protein
MKKDSRLTLCLQYRLRGLTHASLIYLLVFVLVDLVLPLVLFGLFGRRIFGFENNAAPGDGNTLVSYSFLLSAMIFLFVGFVASFREDFDFLLALNNTRKNQYLSSLLSLLIASAAFFCTALLIRPLEILVEAVITRTSAEVLFNIWLAEFARPPECLSGLALALVVCLSACSLGLTAGILSYRFGRRFVIPFWICFGTSFIFVPILLASNEMVLKAAIWFSGAQTALPALALAWHLAVIDLLLLALGALTIRKLPQSNI